MWSVHTRPSGKFESQKITKKNWDLKKKIVIFFNKIANGNFVGKNDNFYQFFFSEKARGNAAPDNVTGLPILM